MEQISLTKGEVKHIKVKLHPLKIMHYLDYDGLRVSEFFSTEKQGTFQKKKIDNAFNKFETWEVNVYEELK